MSELNLVSYPEAKLNCRDVEQFPVPQKIIDRFFEIIKEKNGVGLAAPQLGIDRRFFVVNYDGLKQVFVNPRIGYLSNDRKKAREECLSMPGEFYWIRRCPQIRVSYADENGRRFMGHVMTGWLARIVQHEFDHINGVCIKDKRGKGL